MNDDGVRSVLSGKISGATLNELYGIDAGRLELGKIDGWCRHTLGKRFAHSGDVFDRVAFEEYLHLTHVGTTKTLGLLLGISAPAFEVVLKRLIGMREIPAHLVDDDSDLLPAVVVDHMLTWAFERPLPRGPFRTSSQRTAMFLRVVDTQLNLVVDPLIDATGDLLGEEIACNVIDILSGIPMAQKYAVWLSLRKPLSLPPDVSSYRRVKELLERGVLGAAQVMRPVPRQVAARLDALE